MFCGGSSGCPTDGGAAASHLSAVIRQFTASIIRSSAGLVILPRARLRSSYAWLSHFWRSDVWSRMGSDPFIRCLTARAPQGGTGARSSTAARSCACTWDSRSKAQRPRAGGPAGWGWGTSGTTTPARQSPRCSSTRTGAGRRAARRAARGGGSWVRTHAPSAWPVSAQLLYLSGQLAELAGGLAHVRRHEDASRGAGRLLEALREHLDVLLALMCHVFHGCPPHHLVAHPAGRTPRGGASSRAS